MAIDHAPKSTACPRTEQVDIRILRPEGQHNFMQSSCESCSCKPYDACAMEMTPWNPRSNTGQMESPLQKHRHVVAASPSSGPNTTAAQENQVRSAGEQSQPAFASQTNCIRVCSGQQVGPQSNRFRADCCKFGGSTPTFHQRLAKPVEFFLVPYCSSCRSRPLPVRWISASAHLSHEKCFCANVLQGTMSGQ